MRWSKIISININFQDFLSSTINCYQLIISRPTKKNPNSGDSYPDRKSPGYPEGKNPNPRDFAKIPGIKIPKLRKILNPGDKNSETNKNS